MVAGVSLAAVHGIDHSTMTVIYALLTALPALLVEMWGKQRRRRDSEQLLVLPDASSRSRGLVA